MELAFTPDEMKLLQRIGACADERGMPCYLVGGYVRDKLLERPCKDLDFVCVGNAIELAQQVAATFRPRPQVAVFKNFGTAQIKIDDLEIEFVGARKESYAAHSRKPDVAPGTIEDDQLRRDFTINALAIAVNKENFGRFSDPFNGLEDLRMGIIRTPLDPVRTFSDDPLRMLRGIRFAAQLGFSIHPETKRGIVDSAERIRIISRERIAEELHKMLRSQKPSVALELLFTTNLLPHFFQQLVDLSGAVYIDGMGHKDNFYHTLQVVDNVAAKSDDLWLRWAALLHDIGKPATKRFEEGHGWTFHGHEVVGARMVPKIFAQLKLPQHEPMKFVQKLVLLHLRPISLTKENITDSAIRRLLFDSGADFDALMLLCEADITSKNKHKVQRYLRNFEMVRQRCREVEEKDQIRNWQPPITGDIIMQTFGMPPSRIVGDLKNAVRDAILDGVVANNYDAAFAFLLEQAKERNLAPDTE